VEQTSLGVSDASAQFPYAGETVPGLPGIAAGLSGLEAPPYPFIASSNAGSPPQTVSYPGVTLRAVSGDFTTEASSVAGQAGAGIAANARIVEDRTGGVSATAATVADSVAIGPYLVLSDVRSAVTVAADATGMLTRKSSCSIGRISMPGLRLTVPKTTPRQPPIPVPVPGVPPPPSLDAPPMPLPAGGQTFDNPEIGIQDGYFVLTVPGGRGPAQYLLPTASTLAAFEAQGVKIRFQAPRETKTGLVSGAYSFEYRLPAPPPNTLVNGESEVTQTTASAGANITLAPTVATAGRELPSSAGTTTGSAGAAAVVPVGAPGTETAPALVGSGALPSTGIGSTGTPPTSFLLAQPTGLSAVQVGKGADDVYLVVAGLALFGVLASTVVRLVGVR
jgi:hypothetical protein